MKQREEMRSRRMQELKDFNSCCQESDVETIGPFHSYGASVGAGTSDGDGLIL